MDRWMVTMLTRYDELIKNLRGRSQFLLPHYGEETSYDSDLMKQAADAIESTSKAYQMMAEAYEAEVTKPKWIPVTERLPEDYGQVLTCDERGNIHLFRHLRQFIYPFGIRPEDPRYFMPKWWMPLPQPPESEGE